MLKKKNKKAERVKPKKAEKKPRRVVIESTQQNIPIASFTNRIIVTKDGRYVKILEVIPRPFLLKNTETQNKIYHNFMGMLKSGPVRMQFKMISTQTDLSPQISKLIENEKKETSPLVKEFYEDYRAKLIATQNRAVTQRYFIVFEYVGDAGKSLASRLTSGGNTLDKAAKWLNDTAAFLRSQLKGMDDGCLTFADVAEEDMHNQEILYAVLNRGFGPDLVPWQARLSAVNDRYQAYYMGKDEKDIYVPPLDNIAPISLDFRDTHYMKINNLYYKFFFIPGNGYPSVLYVGWLINLINSCPLMDIDVFTERDDSADLNERLRRAMGHSAADNASSSANSAAADASARTYGAASYLKSGIENGYNVFYVSTMITVMGYSLQDVNDRAEYLIRNCNSADITICELKAQNEQAFISSLPLAKLAPTIKERAQRNMLTNGAATFYPWLTYSLIAPDGIYVGNDRYTHAMIVLDYWDRSLGIGNANIFMCGTSGAGKTFALLLQAIRAHLSRIPVYIIAPEKENEFKRLTEKLNGQFVQVSPGSPNRINPMEIFQRDRKAEEEAKKINGSGYSTSLLVDKVRALDTIIMMQTGQLDLEERNSLETAIYDTYEKFGITQDNDSLWADEEHTRFKPMPIFSDLRETLVQENAEKKLIAAITMFTNGTFRCFNGQTNVDTSKDFIVFGLEHNSDDALPLAVFIAMDFVWSKIKEDQKQKKFLMIDEWWRMAFNPLAANYSMEISKTIRAYSGGVLFATQQITDVLQADSVGAGIIGNCDTKIVMKMSDKNARAAIGDLVDLSEEERQQLGGFEPGDAILVSGSNHYAIHFDASDRERILCGTDSQSVSDYIAYEEKAKKEKMEQHKRQIEQQVISDSEPAESDEEFEAALRHAMGNRIADTGDEGDNDE